MTREQISACLLQQWKMPEELVTATRQQHNPEFEGEHSEFSRLLYVAGRSLRSNGFGDGAREKPELYVLDSLGLTQESVDEVTQNILLRLDDLGELVQMLKGK